MHLRRLATSAPLAVLVAVLAHVAGFGRSHAPGAEHAADLLAGLALALATLAGSVVLRHLVEAASGRPSVARAAERAASPNGLARSVVGLSALAVVVFAAIELLEGHGSTGGSLRALAALVPLATLVTVGAARAKRSLRGLGARLGAALVVRVPRAARALAGRGGRRLIVRRSARAGRRCGRAPPLTA